MNIDIQKLFAEIGRMHVENMLLKEELAKLQPQVDTKAE